VEWAYDSLTLRYVNPLNTVDDKDVEPDESGAPSGTVGEPTASRTSLRGRYSKQNTILGRTLGIVPETVLGEVPDDSPLKELEETLDIRKRVLGPSHAKTLKSMRTLADQYSKLGYLQNGIVMFKQRMEAASKVYKQEDPRLVIIKNDLALAYSKVKDFPSAVKIAEEINEILPLAFSPEDTNFLTMRYNLGYFYENVGELSKSAEIYEEVVRSYRESRGSRDSRTLTLALNGLESVYTRLGRYSDAVRICKQILEIQKQTVGPKSGQALWTMKVIAQHYRNLRKTKEAIAMYEQIFEIRQESKGPEHQTTLNALSDLAQAYIDDGQKEEAKNRMEKVLVLMKRVRGDEHPDTLDLRDNIALISLGGDIPTQDPNELDDSLFDDLGDLGLGFS
jgi:tetratricopeptide (TPR) repeat protein